MSETLAPRPGTPGRGVGGEGLDSLLILIPGSTPFPLRNENEAGSVVDRSPPHPQPLSPRVRWARGDRFIKKFSKATSQLSRRAPRSGLTLFEVLISLVIFVGAMAAIGQLVSNGVRGALQARFQSQAAILCETKLAEVVAGIVPLASGQGQYADDPNWSWTLVVTAAPVPGLLRAEVTVKRQGSNSKSAVTFNMARYVRDPQLYYAAQEEAEQMEQEKQESQETQQ